MLKTFVFLITLSVLFSCEQSNQRETPGNKAQATGNEVVYKNASATSSSAGTANDTSGNSSSSAMENRKKIIRNAELRFRVSDIDSATEQIEFFAQQHNGYVSTSNLISTYDKVEDDMIVKVPADQFENILKQIQHLAMFIDNRNIKSDDVTAEYVDLQSRLKTKLEVKQRYEEILRSKSKTVEDILKAEQQIGSLQEEIEASEGRLRYLSSQVAYSTIHLSYYQQITVKEAPVTAKHNFWTDIASRFSNGLEIVRVFLFAIVNIWPLLIAATIIYIFARKRFFRRRLEAPAALK